MSDLSAAAALGRIVMFDPGNFVPYYVNSLCGSLEKLDLRIRVITSPPLFESVERTGLYRIDALFFPFLRDWSQARVRHHQRLRQAVKVVSYPFGLWRTWRALRLGPPGIFHVQWAPVLALDRLLVRALKGRGWRVIYTAHDPLPERGRRIAHRQYQQLLDLTDAVIVHTAEQARALGAAYAEVADRVHVIPHGSTAWPLPSADERREDRRVLGVEPDRPLLLFFGMLKPYKGLDDLVAAMPEVLARFPEALLIIAGEPLMPLRSLRRQIARLGLARAVSLRARFVPRDDVSSYLRAADVLIAPYLRIGASGVVALAQGYGLPVVVTRVGGLPEFVEPDRCGFVVPAHEPFALAEAICLGLRDREALAEMGRRAWKRIVRKNDWAEVARQTLAVYRGDRG